MAHKKQFDLDLAVVIGGGEFPYDMLRYDRCFPYSESPDSSALGQYGWTKRAVVVARYHGQPGGWTPARWASFGWEMRGQGSGMDAVRLQGDLTRMWNKERESAQKTGGA